jgi:hypothetical protein
LTSLDQSEALSFPTEIITEKLSAVFILVAIKAEIFPVGAIRGVILGIAILVVHR